MNFEFLMKWVWIGQAAHPQLNYKHNDNQGGLPWFLGGLLTLPFCCICINITSEWLINDNNDDDDDDDCDDDDEMYFVDILFPKQKQIDLRSFLQTAL